MAILLIVSCSEVGPIEEEEGIIDLRADYPDPGEDGYQILTPDLDVAPYTEELYCYYGQWTGPQVGVVSYIPLHPNQFHHHSLVKDAVLVEGIEPGDFESCGEEYWNGVGVTDPDDPETPPMMSTAPLFHAIMFSSPQGEGDRLNLPPGMAIKFAENQLWTADVHFINTTDKLLKVNVAFNLEMVPSEEVEHWVSSFDFDSGQLDLPPGEETTVAFDCPLDGGTELLSVLAHMHSFGESYRIELVRGTGEIETLLYVGKWEDDYRFSSPSRGFRPGELIIEEGDKLRTTCTWFNSSPNALSFPDEMCTTSGAIVDVEEAINCIGERVDPE
jgi:hypothetical protein